MSESYDSSGRTLEPSPPVPAGPAPSGPGYSGAAMGQSSEVSSGWIQLRPDAAGYGGSGAYAADGSSLDGLVGQVAHESGGALPHRADGGRVRARLW
jgi:hypothetical protein